MASEALDEQVILDALRAVPKDRWPDVQAYLGSLQSVGRPGKRPLTAADLLQSGLIGLWADRSDLGDSREFARRLREQAQARSQER